MDADATHNPTTTEEGEDKELKAAKERMHGWRKIPVPNDANRQVLEALELSEIIYVVNENIANEYLQYITDGPVGFDTEFTGRKPSVAETQIMGMKAHSPTAKKNARSVLQYLELFKDGGFNIDWERAGLCTVQICVQSTTWVLDMKKIRALPQELKRIMTDPDITLVGVGLVSDVNVIWEDLRIDMQSLADVGLMAMLWRPEDHADEAFRNLSLEAAAQKVLGVTIDKGRQKTTTWSEELSDEDITYAAIDAAASLRLFETLVSCLAEKETLLEKNIPQSWYTFNSTEGELTRTKKSFRGGVIGWSTRDCTWFVGGKFQGYFP
ncbi:ribonuclease H-like domain-containing protein [Mycena metata]|uniref:Ribonuclease H-like domain-containing protein n=1 Tax=Mycena metata TaxID=1033252 RepID=A0AAD7H103_9AGAR|nr:ribonuclease H-like domain-containing protein [Mycena metata]